MPFFALLAGTVALRKESVDRNVGQRGLLDSRCVALRKESVDRNNWRALGDDVATGRSPQGERG